MPSCYKILDWKSQIMHSFLLKGAFGSARTRKRLQIFVQVYFLSAPRLNTKKERES